MNNYLAIGLAEGFIESESEKEILQAWSYIGKNKLYKNLQGFFGRTLEQLINAGYLDKEYNVIYEEYREN